MATQTATINVTPYITVRGTVVPRDQLPAGSHLAEGRTAVMANGKIFQGIRLEEMTKAA
jgi:hypothetical protein